MKLYVERVAGEVHVAGVGLGHWRCGSGVVVASFTSISVSHGLCLVWVLFCFHFQLSFYFGFRVWLGLFKAAGRYQWRIITCYSEFCGTFSPEEKPIY